MALVQVANTSDLLTAVSIWQTANEARGKPPTPARVARVQEKLEDPLALVLIARDGDEVVGMLLAEQAWAEPDQRTVEGCGHIGMIFVRPDRWGERIGSDLLRALLRHGAARGWTRFILWTGEANRAARKLYEREGYTPTGEAKLLDDTFSVLQYAR